MNTGIRASEENTFRANATVAAGRPSRGIFAWIRRHPQLFLALLTVACLLPFSGKAFHIDDPIFIWTAQHIVHHPLDFYGFNATWWWLTTPMWQVQQNPPLAAYYMALIGSLAGWSESALHLGFLLPAVVVVLATYHLARRFTHSPFIAAAATLVAPGFLVSATSLMCDVSMLALWMLAIVFWLKGLDTEQGRPRYLASAAVLMALCALTKYFGMALLPLLFAYSLFRRRSFRPWLGYLLIPVAMWGGYEIYTHHLYGHGLIGQAFTFKSQVRAQETPFGRALVGLAFAGGCALPALTFVPALWSRRQMLWGAAVSAILALSFWRGWISLGTVYKYQRWFQVRSPWVPEQMFFYIAGAISLLALALSDSWKKRDAASLLLLLWVLGTMFFAIVVYWTVNARSLLPMLPAVAILIVRRLEDRETSLGKLRWAALAVPLIISGAIALWVAAGDMALAKTAREAAGYIHEKTREDTSAVWFEGRWGFEYYMQEFGARPLEPDVYRCKFGDLVVIPQYNTALAPVGMKVATPEHVDFKVHTWVTTMNPDAGAGFYFSGWGPLPFVFGPVPQQKYLMARVLENGNGQ